MFWISLLLIKFHFLPKADLKTLNQPLDHFSDDGISFEQRYYETFRYLTNDNFSKVVLYVGGEATLVDSDVEAGSQYVLAQTLQAALFSLEHRFFGDSLPFPFEEIRNNISLIEFLTVDQALADLAYFVENVIRKHPRAADKISVVVVGGSYPGMLSGWFRLKYPELVDASWSSSSSPIIKNAYTGYDEHGAEVFQELNSTCYEKAHRILNDIEDVLFGDDEDAKDKLKTALSELPGLSDANVLSDLDILNGIANYFLGQIQYYRIEAPTIDKICDLVDILEDTFEQGINQINRKKLQEKHFFDFLINQHLPFKNYQFKEMSDIDNYFWEWIMCHEIGGFPIGTGNLKSQRINISFFEKSCLDMFELQSLANETEGNLKYGALNPPVTKVFYTEGKLDPWSGLGVVSPNEEKQIKSIYIKDASHCADLFPFTYRESSELTDTRIQVINQLVNWINEKESSKETSDSIKEGDYFGALISTIILGVLLIVAIVIIFVLWKKTRNSSEFS